ncbi:NAD-dependent epimerase/dehydratase family protein [Candidatus Pelagibacter sp.]|nr:NAD-dependent epimerase/dehydratase family protein [Candidatus Pelagibacter sp.]
MKKNILVVTGGAGFVGSNLIETLIKKYKSLRIISLDNYSSGKKQNHIKSKHVKYIKCETRDIFKVLQKYKNKISTIFHFGEFSRIYQSFREFDQCYESNVIGSKAVFSFCLKNKIKLIYSATSATFGKNNLNKNLSPYAFTKSNNIELLNNLNKWFNFKFEIIYFYNVYGKRQICEGKMATVIGIFQKQYKDKKPLTIVRPGNQTRKFTHIDDTINVCIEAWKNKKCAQYSISSKYDYSIIDIAKMFGGKIKFLPFREGERYASQLTKMNLSKQVIRKIAHIKIDDYIDNFKKNLLKF